MLGGVHDGSGQLSGGAVELGALLALLHGGDAAFDQVEVTYRMWRHDERAAAAWRAAIEEEKRPGAAITSYGPSSDSGGEEVSLMLDPTLLGSLRFTPVGRGHVCRP
jgi:hypothetical protein